MSEDEAWIASEELAAGLLPQSLHDQVRDEQLERQIEVMVHRVANKVFPKYRFRHMFCKPVVAR